ncbi:MAG: hypothetical protein U1E46_16725 [Hyphomicrobiales bacterium]
MSFRMSLAVVLVAASLQPAFAGTELAGPEGVPWWKSLAACAGVELRQRDLALDAKAPQADVAKMTVAMNGYNTAATQRLMADLGIEEVAAKKSVYRWAAMSWQKLLDTKASLKDVGAKSAACEALAAKAPKIQ